MTKVNSDLQLALDYISDTGTHVFLTGKAGTGKTTFLHNLKKKCSKRMMVAAPTGVAAINAGGVTLHSLFQLPFGPFLPGVQNLRSPLRFSKEKKKTIVSLDLLVIDEISMVRADLLDAIDDVLRRLRRNNLPFGGVQLLLIGDLYQLPPVVKKEDWQYLGNHYSSPYFFSSTALARTEMVTIELKKVYRQSDDHFIEILNKVRNNELEKETLAVLNRRVNHDFSEQQPTGYITLCSHNNRADAINQAHLESLDGFTELFEAEIEGEFPEQAFPAAATLELKTGAQVMFIRNDSSVDKLYFNGKIGTITATCRDTISVKCPEDENEIEVQPVCWENIEYQLDEESQMITEKKIGAFHQYPLRLAWAITIHKSQGLTFDRAIIDAEAAFAHGQVYVALSRCRSLEGMVLATPITAKSMKTDENVVRFTKASQQNFPTAGHLHNSRIGYQRQLILQCFDLSNLRSILSRLVSMVDNSAERVRLSGVHDLKGLQLRAEEEIFTVSGNFQRQLNTLFQDTVPPAEDNIILERIAKGSEYFCDKMHTALIEPFSAAEIESDNKDLAKKSRNILKMIREMCLTKLAAIESCKDGFSPTTYFRALSTAQLQTEQKKAKKKTDAVTYTESDIAHPELYQTLKKWRNSKAESENIAHFQVLHQKTLINLVVHLPDTLKKFEQIKGIGKVLSERYGAELVQLITDYRRENDIEEVILPSAPVQTTKTDGAKKDPGNRIPTQMQTFELFEKGLSPAEIGTQRQLTLSTIEGHLAHLVEKGKVSANSLLTKEKLQMICDEIARIEESSLKAIKNQIAGEVSYGEIRFAQAHLKYLQNSKISS